MDLAAGWWVEGRTVDAGRPAGGVLIGARDATATSGRDGTFRLGPFSEDVTRVEVTVVARGGGRETQRRAEGVRGAPLEMDVTGVRLRGRGSPRPGSVRLACGGHEWHGEIDAAGGFVVDGAPASSACEIHLRAASGKASAVRQVRTPADGELDVGVIDLESRRIRIRVEPAEAADFVRAELMSSACEPVADVRPVREADGSLVLEAGGGSLLRIVPPDAFPGRRRAEVIVAVPETGDADVVAFLPVSATLGVVAPGAAHASLSVELLGEAGCAERRTWLDEDGRGRIVALAPGEHAVSVTTDRGTVRETVFLAEGDAVELMLSAP